MALTLWSNNRAFFHDVLVTLRIWKHNKSRFSELRSCRVIISMTFSVVISSDTNQCVHPDVPTGTLA